MVRIGQRYEHSAEASKRHCIKVGDLNPLCNMVSAQWTHTHLCPYCLLHKQQHRAHGVTGHRALQGTGLYLFRQVGGQLPEYFLNTALLLHSYQPIQIPHNEVAPFFNYMKWTAAKWSQP